MHDRREPTLEESVDALEGGDALIEVSAARAALASRDFRIVWLGAMASNVGTWMQNVTLGAFAWELTGSPAFVGLAMFAQLGPQLVLAVVGGALADVFDRRRLIIVAQTWQMLASFVLAAVAAQDTVSKPALLAAVFAVGIGGAINAPAWSALVPSLVDRQHLAGAISLNSAQLNGARVIGPAIGGALYPAFGAASVFAVNAVTYLFGIGTMLAVRSRPVIGPKDGPRGLRRISEGITTVRRNPILRRCIVTITVFSLLSLPIVGHMPTIAEENLGISTKSLRYGLLYTVFGLGAVVGALSIGTFLARQDLRRMTQLGIGAFSVLLLTYGLLSDPAPAYPVAAMLGFAYFMSITSLSTVLQEEVDDAFRGRVMSLWQMGFGGTVPIGVLIAGQLAEVLSIRFVTTYGAVVAAGLCLYARGTRRVS